MIDPDDVALKIDLTDPQDRNRDNELKKIRQTLVAKTEEDKQRAQDIEYEKAANEEIMLEAKQQKKGGPFVDTGGAWDDVKAKWMTRDTELGEDRGKIDASKDWPDGEYNKELFRKILGFDSSIKDKQRTFKISLFEFQLKNLMSETQDVFLSVQLGHDFKVTKTKQRGVEVREETGGSGIQYFSE
jgi:hypothetical protein